MARLTQVELTNMCLICDEEKVLVQEKVGTKYKGGLVFPGGHVEPGESILESVIREMKEETGLTICNPKLCGVKDWMEDDGSRFVVFLYRADQFSGELKSSEEGRVYWLSRREMDEANFIWNMRELMNIFEGSYSEFYIREVDGQYIRTLEG